MHRVGEFSFDSIELLDNSHILLRFAWGASVLRDRNLPEASTPCAVPELEREVDAIDRLDGVPICLSGGDSANGAPSAI